MRVFALTSLGSKVAATKYEDSDRFKILAFLREHKTGTMEELSIVGDRHIVRQLIRKGLVKELTTD